MSSYIFTTSLLFLCFVQSTYSMETTNVIVNSPPANVKLLEIIESVIKNHNFSQQAVKDTKNCILEGANPNLKFAKDGETLLRLALKYRQKDLFYFLLEHNADINGSNKYGDTLLHFFAIAYDNNAKFDIHPKDLIKHKADIHASTVNGSTPLHSAVYASNVDVIKLLIKLGADINQKCQERPLEIAIDPIRDYDGNMIKELCKYRASLTNITPSNDNIFYRIIELTSKNRVLTARNVRNNESIQQIKAIITHARFDDFDKGSKETVWHTLLALNRLEKTKAIKKLPKDIKLHILAQLPLSDLYPYKKLCEYLLKNKPHILLPAIYKRVANIKQILATPNNENTTALQLALEKFANKQEHLNKLIPLLDGTLLQKNYNDFIECFPNILNSERDKKNLVRQMFDNCAKLFLE